MRNIRILLFLASFSFVFVACGDESSSKGAGEKVEMNKNTPKPEPSETKSNKEGTYRPFFMLQKGATWESKTQSTEKTKTEGEVFKQSYIMKVKYLLEDVTKEGLYSVRATFSHIQYDFSGPKGKLSFNSSQDDEEDNTSWYAVLAGESFNMTVEPLTGEVLEVKGGNEIYAGFEDKAMEENGNAILKEMMNPDWHIFPNGDVVEGGTWKRQFQHRTGYNSAYDCTFSFIGQEDERFKIKNSMSISPATETIPTAEGSNKAVFKLTGTGNQSFSVDIFTGLTLSSFSNQSLSGTVQNMNGDKKGEEVPIAIEIETHTEVTKG